MYDVIKINLKRRYATRSSKGNQPLNIKTAAERPILKLGLPNFRCSFYFYFTTRCNPPFKTYFMTLHMTFSRASFLVVHIVPHCSLSRSEQLICKITFFLLVVKMAPLSPPHNRSRNGNPSNFWGRIRILILTKTVFSRIADFWNYSELRIFRLWISDFSNIFKGLFLALF